MSFDYHLRVMPLGTKPNRVPSYTSTCAALLLSKTHEQHTRTRTFRRTIVVRLCQSAHLENCLPGQDCAVWRDRLCSTAFARGQPPLKLIGSPRCAKAVGRRPSAGPSDGIPTGDFLRTGSVDRVSTTSVF